MTELAIPVFLRRRKRRSPPPAGSGFAPMPIRRPEGEEWQDAQRVDIFLEDEIPKLGCGWRGVWAVVDADMVRVARGQRCATITLARWIKLQRQAEQHGRPLGQLTLGLLSVRSGIGAPAKPPRPPRRRLTAKAGPTQQWSLL